jgi:phage gp36-like protein
MSYCTRQNMIERFGEPELIQLTDTVGAGVIDDVVLDQAMDDAAAEINSYLSMYSLPLATVPAKFVRMACDIARYFLYDDAATDEVVRRFEAAIAYLKMIGTGKIVLGPDITGQKPMPGNSPVITSDTPVFGRESY